MSTDDEPLVCRATRGDRGALRTLLQQFGPTVRDWIDGQINSVWRSSFDADDVMQVTYLEAFLHQGKLDIDSDVSFEAWLRRIATNNLRDAIKQLSRHKRPHPRHRVQAIGNPDDSYVMLLDDLSDSGDTPSRHIAREEIAEVLRALVEQLPADYAKVIRQYDLEGTAIDVVARNLGRSPGAVHMLRARAHDRLRSLIKDETDFFSKSE